MATYEVDLYAKWDREGHGAREFIDAMKDDELYYGRSLFPCKVVNFRVTKQDIREERGLFSGLPYTEVDHEYGTFHVRLDVNANNERAALTDAKSRIVRWLKRHACSPPTIEWL